MSVPTDTLAARVLASIPTLRTRIAASSDFTAWRDGHRSFVDGDAHFYIVGGDITRDEDEMMLDWARQQNLVPRDLLARLAGNTSDYE